MNMRNGARAPIRLVGLFLLMAGVPLAVLGWAAWRVLEHDLAQEQQQLQKRLVNATALATREIDRSLSAWEDILTAAAQGDSAGIPPGSAVLVFGPNGLLTRHGRALPYYPSVSAPKPEPSQIFAEAEEKEFGAGNDAALAPAFYRELAKTSNRAVRAGALMRLARSLTQQQRLNEALKASAELSMMGEVPVGSFGDPAELVARKMRIAVLERTGDAAAKSREASLLAAALSEGRYPIDWATFDAYWSAASAAELDAIPLVDAVEGLWPVWKEHSRGRTLWQGTKATTGFIAVWRQTPAGTAVLVSPLEALLAPTSHVVRDPEFRFSLEDETGQTLWGTFFEGGIETKQALREAGLKATLRISADSALVRKASAARRNVLAAGFGLMALVTAAASYFVFRALTREFRVAQLQSDFVSAVSHEFRTPLAAMRHLTDLLEEGGISPQRLTACYAALGKETRRLHAMVESLLDFARMESGRRAYDMTETNAVELTETLVDEFRQQRHLSAHRLEWRPPETQPGIRADRDAISLALRNLLDNAVKYSPEASTVRVSVESRDGFAGITVEDQGMGIGPREQRDIFRKFVRGQAARALHVKGTGIGLTMANQIVKAHGGRIELESQPQRGSRFTIVLPLTAEKVSVNGVH